MMSPESLSAVDCITAIIDGSGITVNVWSHRSGDSLAHSADDISDDVHLLRNCSYLALPPTASNVFCCRIRKLGRKTRNKLSHRYLLCRMVIFVSYWCSAWNFSFVLITYDRAYVILSKSHLRSFRLATSQFSQLTVYQTGRGVKILGECTKVALSYVIFTSIILLFLS